MLYSNFTAKWRNQTVGDLFLKTAARVPDKVHKRIKVKHIRRMLFSNFRPWWFFAKNKEMSAWHTKSVKIYQFKLHDFFNNKDIKRYHSLILIIFYTNCQGDVVGLVMENRLEYTCYWLGLSYIGVIPALVNTNLRF